MYVFDKSKKKYPDMSVNQFRVESRRNDLVRDNVTSSSAFNFVSNKKVVAFSCDLIRGYVFFNIPYSSRPSSKIFISDE